MGKFIISFFRPSQWLLASFSFVNVSSAAALDKPFPNISENALFRTAVETALAEKKYFFVFQDRDESSRTFVIDYDPSFFYSYRSRPDVESFKAYMSHGFYRASEVKSFPYDRVEYRLSQKIRIPKVAEWEAENGKKWSGNFENWEGEWEEHAAPSFNFFLTAYDSEEEESEVNYLDERGRISMRSMIRVINLAKKFYKEKLAECMALDSLSQQNERIEETEYYKEELIHDVFKGSNTDYQAYLAALKAKLASELEIKIGNKLFTSDVIAWIREQTHLPQHVIVQIMEERI